MSVRRFTILLGDQKHHRHFISSPRLSFLFANLYFFSASYDCIVRLWDVSTNKCVREFHYHSDTVYTLSFSTHGTWLASGGFDGRVIVWDVKVRL